MVLLITSAISVAANFTKLKCSTTRAELIKESILSWHKTFPNLKIVICDGSGYNFYNSEVFENILNNKQLEFLSFKNNSNQVKKLGKGFGEGEIIEYALSNSTFLKASDYFAKITGKLFVKNAEYFLNNPPKTIYCHFNFNYSKIFFPRNCSTVDTRFYVVSKQFYIIELQKLYRKVNETKGLFLEHVFYTKLNLLISNGYVINYWCVFYISGISGSMGTPYPNNNLTKKIINSVRSVIQKSIFKLNK